MSQYPSPYSSPQYPGYYDYYMPRGNAPAKRASILMIVLGVLILAMSLCFAGIGQLLRGPSTPAEIAQQMSQVEAEAGIPPGSAARMLVGMGIFMFVYATATIALGIVVRRGTMVPIALALVFAGISILLIGLMLVGSVINIAGKGSPQAATGICIFAIPLALLILLVVWLIQAMRAVSSSPTPQQMYAAQMWAYQQQQQQSPYGYAQPPAPQARAERSAAPDRPPEPPPPPPNAST